MKKIILCLGLITVITLSSCEKKVTTETTETTTTTPAPSEPDTVVVKHEAPVEEKGTSVKINNEGVDVDSKDVDVEIKK